MLELISGGCSANGSWLGSLTNRKMAWKISTGSRFMSHRELRARRIEIASVVIEEFTCFRTSPSPAILLSKSRSVASRAAFRSDEEAPWQVDRLICFREFYSLVQAVQLTTNPRNMPGSVYTSMRSERFLRPLC